MLKVTYLGTTTLLFDDGKDQILFDAHITRPSLSSYIRGAKESTNRALCDEIIRLHHIDRLRAVFISHTHHDHVMDAPYIAGQCGAKIFGSESAKNVALGGGISAENITVFKHGDSFDIGDYQIRILKSIHSKPTVLNNDLGEPIKEPLIQPARLRDYKEGGSYDFYIECQEKKLLIRPSFNYIEGFRETIEKTGAKLVIPIHWDNFFSPLDRPIKGMPPIIENTGVAFFKTAKYCESHDVNFLIQYPRTSMEI